MVESYYNDHGESGSVMDSKFGGKQKHGGAGGKSSKSTNFKECKNANKRRNEKNEREIAKEEAIRHSAHVKAETVKWAPVDKKDSQNLKKQQMKVAMEREAAAKKEEKRKLKEEDDF